MANSIAPKLAVGLQTELSLAPGASNLAPWHWAMAWAALLPPEQLVQLLEQSFFPQWHAVLHHWLAHAPNYDQVTAWYLQWKVCPFLLGWWCRRWLWWEACEGAWTALARNWRSGVSVGPSTLAGMCAAPRGLMTGVSDEAGCDISGPMCWQAQPVPSLCAVPAALLHKSRC